MRRTSVSLPTRNNQSDPHEKLARYSTPKGSSARFVDKVENIKTAWMNQSQRSRWLKTGGLLFFIVFLFYYLAPRGTGVNMGGGGNKGGQTPSDSSYGTPKCSKSYDSSEPIVQYVLMIDAGSTGSRIHVYKFNNCGAMPELEEETFKETAKIDGQSSGLSSFDTDAEGAAKSLDVLLNVAMEKVPDKLKACTPVAVKATAGLRKLGDAKSENILKAVRKRLETVYPFPVVSEQEGGVQVMDGSDEGVYAWITTNWLLGKIGSPEKGPTAAIFDLGGGSTQIVFEPTFKSPSHGMPAKLEEGDHKYVLDFGGRKFELYQHSHFGYGLMEARRAIHKTLVEGIHKLHPSDNSWLHKSIVNPCIAPGMVRPVEVQLGKGHALGESIKVNMTGPSSPATAQCRGLAEKILKKDEACGLAPCSFNGIHQPPLDKTFAKEDIYVFSYFYDRTQPLGMPDSFTLKEMHDLTTQVCGGESQWDMFENIPDAMKELYDRPEWCLDLNFQMALLHTGYELPIDREVKIAKTIKGNELGWALGASLPLLSKNSGWKCRYSEVH